MNRRERMLAAIECETPDRVPLSFMIFNALQARSDGWTDFCDRSLDMGIDPVVSLMSAAPGEGADNSDCPGTPVHFVPDVKTREWRERPPDARYALLHKEYETPAGTLSVCVQQTDDWPYGDHVPFLNDYIEPRATKRLITSLDDLNALEYLLQAPAHEELVQHREAWAEAKRYAEERQLLTTIGWGVGVDALAWLFGLTNSVMAAVDNPELLEGLLQLIHRWNMKRMEIMLETKPDLFVRRAWYEGTSFWSPDLYRRFLLPPLKAEVEMAHQAGARFGYILTVGATQFAEMLLESGVDVVIGVDDVQDHGMDFPRLKSALGGKVALWGGVNGFLHIEEGREADIEKATLAALDKLGPDGFILSPVDNIRDASEAVWRKVLYFIDVWKRAVA